MSNSNGSERDTEFASSCTGDTGTGIEQFEPVPGANLRVRGRAGVAGHDYYTTAFIRQLSGIREALCQLGVNVATCLDLGAGRGTIGIALALTFPEARVVISDVNPEALALTRENCELNGLADRVETRLGSALEHLRPGEKFDLVTSTLPTTTVPSGAVGGLGSRQLELLDGGPDGTKNLFAVARALKPHLSDRGRGYLMFSSFLDVPRVRSEFQAHGLRTTVHSILTKRLDETTFTQSTAPYIRDVLGHEFAIDAFGRETFDVLMLEVCHSS